jgi:hypothetical protein
MVMTRLDQCLLLLSVGLALLVAAIVLPTTAAAPVVVNSEYALFDGFEGNYIIHGSACVNSNLSSVQPNCTRSTMVVDTDNSRLYLDIGIGGRFWLLNDTTYATLGSYNLQGKCAVVTNFTYAMQVQHYRRAFAITNSNDQFLGSVWDVASCTYPVAVLMQTRRVHRQGGSISVLTHWNYQQDFPAIYAEGPYKFDLCVRADGRITFDAETVDVTTARDSYFELPAVCKEKHKIVDFCSESYYTGSQCSAYITD